MPNAKVGIATAAAVAALAAGCSIGSTHAGRGGGGASACGTVKWHGAAVVPHVLGAGFTTALRRLLVRHLRVAVPHFGPFHDAMAEQGWGRLANYRVVGQSLPAGADVRAGAVVTLRLSNPIFRGQLGSMAEPAKHPRYATIPDLIGKHYAQAMAAQSIRSGVLVRVSTTAPLVASASTCGLDAFVVESQSPRPGTRVPWGGIHLDGSGVQPSLATVTIGLTTR